MTTLSTPLCKLLGMKYPIIQAGMAGGPTTPELVASVSNAGGLGTLGAAYMTPEDMRTAIRRIKELTAKPFAVNLFVVNMTDDWTRLQEAQAVLNPMREALQIPQADQNQAYATVDRFEEQFAVLLEEQVPVISTAFGVLSDAHMQAAHRQGSVVTTMVTTVREALLAEEQGTDVIVAQGSDAGGHRSTFDMKNHPQGALVGTFSLVPQVVDAVRIPVIAAGGIMDGRGLAAALMLGAQGVQLGTRFLTAVESGAHAAYQEALLASDEESTVVTKAFSGRPARGVRNAFIEQVEQSGVAPLPFPSQNTITGDIRRAAAAQNKAGQMSLWAGQATRLLKENQTAEHIVHETVDHAESLLGINKTSHNIGLL
ncbi:NAD(P)H-dependent flavin oxidoreductase [Paenibacillus sp. 481]|uniref:NAD(P)H-dependent flavin oxidoreductase n=1 Tax=Paenibacillus sp. 481 TaxID=2835869 RepID=UPI001E5EF8D1|nr:nitronate monooxygenase family protein [Paenibacillus sp. 481]UHA75535.1 nitronate monooxygenase [Paenibacillus sp. 481]